MILSHLACADAKEHFMNQHQLDNFRRLKEKYFPKLPASLSASDGTFLAPNINGTWCAWERQCTASTPRRTAKTR